MLPTASGPLCGGRFRLAGVCQADQLSTDSEGLADSVTQPRICRGPSASAAAAALIVPMSLQPAIPRRVALQQSPPALRQPDSFQNANSRSPRNYQRTATCDSFACISRGVQCKWLKAKNGSREPSAPPETAPTIAVMLPASPLAAVLKRPLESKTTLAGRTSITATARAAATAPSAGPA